MSAILSWRFDEDGATAVPAGASAQPTISWLNELREQDVRARTALVLFTALLETEKALDLGPEGLRLPRRTIASLATSDLAALDLPGPAQVSLRIRGEDHVASPHFRFRYEMVLPGLPAAQPRRIGAIVSAGERLGVLAEPLYSAVELMDAFNGDPPSTAEERLLAVGRLKALLPEATEIDGQLTDLEVSYATAFTLATFVNGRGEFDFDPRLVCPDEEQPDDNADRRRFRPATTSNLEREFQAAFRRRATTPSRFVLGRGRVLILEPTLRGALEITKTHQDAGPELRRSFATNPFAALAEASPGLRDPSVLERVFFDPAEYGERVRGAGPWETRQIPFLQRAANDWLPPEESIAISRIPPGITREEQLALLRAVDDAIVKGVPTVELHGVTYQVTQDFRDELIRGVPEEIPEPERGTDAPLETPKGRSALQIEDNVDGALFAAGPKSRRVGDERYEHLLRTKLLPHQFEAIRWLQASWGAGERGRLLADDMGLGKTLEALAFLAWCAAQLHSQSPHEPSPFLVVAPTGLLKNWEDEADKHLVPGALGPPLRAYGMALRQLRDPRAEAQGRETALAAAGSVLELEGLTRAPWVLATYETVRDFQFSFAKVPWKVVIFDEIQKIKNPASMITDAAKALDVDFRLGLTGTPVENRAADLWCVIDACSPGRLGTLREFCGRWENASPEELRSLREELVAAEEAPALMLRRLKENHLAGLPVRTAQILDRTMPPSQADAYTATVIAALESEHDSNTVLKTLHRLRSICLHPGDPSTIPDQQLIGDSARYQATFDVLDHLHERGERALLFLEALDHQAALALLIQHRYGLSDPPLCINGSVSGTDRKHRADEFQSGRGFAAMILSPRAGGVGLTLTSANHVIHVSRWWNPAVEDQCNDRVYRIGQKRPVTVYYPRAIHPDWPNSSFDVRLHELLQRKRQLFHELMMPPATTEAERTELFEGIVARPAAASRSQ